MISLNVKVEMNSAAKLFPQLGKRIISITRDSLNAVAVKAEKESVQKVAKETRIPIRFIRNRYTMAGEVKERRVVVRRATTSRLVAELSVYMRGLPVTQIAGAEQRRPGGGVKATGGRFYRGAFKAKGQVFKRRGPARTPLMVPKVGLRQRLTQEFNRRIVSTEGRSLFKREMYERSVRTLARWGLRA